MAPGENLSEALAKRQPKDVPATQERDLIDVVNELQNKLAASGHSVDISLPQIAVVGGQSAGKSSVLESFVRKEFLPRGANLVTRRPTIVQLIPSQGEEYAVFLHKPEERFTDFKLVKKEILEETNRDPGPKGFSTNPISLKIFSPNVLKLTLVDLPGVIKVTVQGQSDDSIQVVRDMVLQYIQKPKCIILAVIPANQDIANSDALDVAKVADPERERTIGVLTKLDLMDKGTDARAVLENKMVYLKRGFVGVLNRGQKEIDDGKDFAFILEKERKFFAEQEWYKHMAHRMGTPYLQRLLQKTLRAHIKECLPEVRHDLSKKLSSYSRELEDFKAALGSGSNSKQFYMTKQIQNFIEDIEIKLMGHSELIDMSELSAGAIINFKLYTEIQNKLKLTLVPDEQKLAVSIMNMHGIRNLLGIQPMILEGVCRDLISQYKNPLQDSVDAVVTILLDAVTESAETMKPYPNMKNDVLYAVQRCIDKEADSTKERLKSHIDSEMCYINLGHPDFDGAVCEPVKPVAEPVKIWDSAGKVENCTTANLTSKLMENESIQQKVQYITIIIMKYLEIVQKQVSDIAIKYIVFFLIKKVLDFIKKELIPTLVDSGHMSSLLEDCEEVFRQKEDLDRTCSTLQEALDAIQSF